MKKYISICAIFVMMFCALVVTGCSGDIEYSKSQITINQIEKTVTKDSDVYQEGVSFYDTYPLGAEYTLSFLYGMEKQNIDTEKVKLIERYAVVKNGDTCIGIFILKFSKEKYATHAYKNCDFKAIKLGYSKYNPGENIETKQYGNLIVIVNNDYLKANEVFKLIDGIKK